MFMEGWQLSIYFSSAVNTIIPILHLGSSNTKEALLALFLVSLPFAIVHLCINVHFFILKVILLFNSLVGFND